MAGLHLSGSICVLVCLSILLLPLGESVTSPSSPCTLDCCQGCVINTYSAKKRTVPVCVNKTYSRRISTSCGFLWWSTCYKYTVGYQYVCTDKTEYYNAVRASCKPNCACADIDL